VVNIFTCTVNHN